MFKFIVKAALVPIYKIQTLYKPCRFLFLVGHMRSGSTLLTHILSSHPKVTGYAETFLRYRSSRQLDQLVHNTSTVRRRILVRPYIMDKVLHNGFLGESILQNENCRFVFLLREPARAIQSHIRNTIQFNTYPDLGPEERQLFAHNYYTTRLPMIEQEALGINDPRRRAFLTHDQLMNRTPEVFRMLEEFLELDTPLSEHYSLTKRTGVFGMGDSSEFIKRGFIDRSITHEPIAIHSWILDQSNELYESLTARLSSLCRCLAPAPTESSDLVLQGATNNRSA